MKRPSHFLITFFLLFSPLFAVAAIVPGGNTGYPPTTPGGSTGNPSINYSVQNPLEAKSIPQFIEQVLQAAVIIGIPVAVLFIVYAGFLFVVAVGNPKKIDDAKWNLFYTIIGIGIFLGAWIIAKVIFNTVTSLGA